MRLQLLTVGLILVTIQGSAQDPAPSDREVIQQLVQEIQQLKSRLTTLEAERATTSNHPENTAVLPSAASTASANDATPTPVLEALHELHGIQWRGFGEVDYRATDQRTPELGAYGFVPGSAGNFFTGDFDLLLTSRINDKASVLAELVFIEKDAQAFRPNLERLLFKYDFNDHLRISLGRYHTGIGYYNTTFHSGRWLQTATDRPLIMEEPDEGGALPTQAVGVSLTGSVPSGRLGLHYLAEYGSSDTVRQLINGTGSIDENNGNHVNVGFFMRPEFFPGLQLGASVYHDRISDFDLGPSVRLSQTILNAHLVYVGHGFEFLNEGFLIRHAYEHSSTIYAIPAFYTEASRKFGRIRPYVRYQYMNANAGSVLQDISLRHGPSFGTRFDFDDNIALKTQLDHILRKGQPDLNQLNLQLAFTF
jgi:hypothetical protein